MGYEVRIVADSLAHHAVRLTTFQLRYPMKVHWDLLMHRAFSRSASSGRAISVSRFVRWTAADPARPLAWVGDATQMRSGGRLDDATAVLADATWRRAFEDACRHALELERLGVHRQDANALLMPFGWINVCLTATDFANFFALRIDPAARPEMQKLAVMMARAYREGEPVARPWAADGYHEAYHLPYVTAAERESHDVSTLRDLSTARCARVSYMTREGKAPDPVADLALARRLLAAGHWGPAEHPARTLHLPCDSSGNYRGWLQYRSTLPVHEHRQFDDSILDRDYADREFVV
jgi:hypothetical protein